MNQVCFHCDLIQVSHVLWPWPKFLRFNPLLPSQMAVMRGCGDGQLRWHARKQLRHACLSCLFCLMFQYVSIALWILNDLEWSWWILWIRLKKAADLARKVTELLQPLPMQVQLAPQGEGQKWSEMTEMDRIGQKLQRVIPSLVVLIIYFIYIIIIYIYHIYISISHIYIYISHIYMYTCKQYFVYYVVIYVHTALTLCSCSWSKERHTRSQQERQKKWATWQTLVDLGRLWQTFVALSHLNLFPMTTQSPSQAL